MTHLDDHEAQQGLKRFAASMLDLKPLWPKVVPLFIRWMGEQFDTEGGFMGDPWAPLSPEYARWKSEKYPGKGILIAESDLRKAASKPKRHVTSRTLTLEIVDPKVEYHQDGTDSMPARPLLPDGRLPSEPQDQLDRLADEYVREMSARYLGRS